MDGRNEETAGVVRAPAVPVARTASAGGVDEIRSFFEKLLDEQLSLIDAEAGVVFLLSARAEAPSAFARRLSSRREVPSATRAALEDGAALAAMGRVAKDVAASSEPRVEVLSIAPSGGLYSSDPTHRAVAAPLVAEGRVQGATVALLPGGSGQAGDAARLALLVNRRFETFLLAKHARSETEQKLMLRQTLELLDRGQQASTASDMASVLCDELSQRFRCTRASIGMVRGEEIRVAAISGAAQIDRRTALSVALESVMEECGSQDTEVIYPVPPEIEADPSQRRVVRAHEAFFHEHGHSSMLSLPLRLDGGLVGVIVLEREPDDPFPEAALPLVRLAAEYVGPAIWTRRMADRGIVSVARDSLVDLGETLVGPRHTGWKVLGLGVAAAVVVAAALPIPSRVVSQGEVVAAQVRSVTPPFAAYLDEVRVRPGDRVEAGDVLAVLDASDLELRLAEAEARLLSASTERDDALTRGELAEARQAEASMAESQASINLLRRSIDRAVLRAPIAGEVSAGDLDHAVGSRIEPDRALFEVIGDDRRVVLEVGERDVPRIERGDLGWVSTRAAPGERAPVEVVRINPISEVGEGDAVFRVEAVPVDDGVASAPLARPGTRVTSRIRDGWTTPLAEFARPLIDELRLRLWW